MKKNLNHKFITKNTTSRLYNLSNPIIGLTGGIATGKSTASKILKDLGYFIIDADLLVKEIYKEEDTINFIKVNFPKCFIDGNIDFKLLREEFFSSPITKNQIENFIYKRMPFLFKEKANLANSDEVIIYDVPLLFEKSLDKLVDQSLCVYASKNIQIQRLVARDNISIELAEKILAGQMSIEDKKLKSDWVIDNSSDLANLNDNIKLVFSQLMTS